MWCFVTLAAALVSFAAVQDLPEGDGKKLIEDRCVLCHGVEVITSAKMDRNGWKDMVQKMVGYGTQMDEKEVDVVTDYLSTHFGPEESFEDKTAIRYIEGICASCHNAEFITDTRATRDEWLAIVNDMNGKGAGLSEQDVQLLVNYLAKKYPKN